MHKKLSIIFLLLTVGISSGCVSHRFKENKLRKYAASVLNCPERKLKLYFVGYGNYEAIGCDKVGEFYFTNCEIGSAIGGCRVYAKPSPKKKLSQITYVWTYTEKKEGKTVKHTQTITFRQRSQNSEIKE